jgi:5'-nucleotidase
MRILITNDDGINAPGLAVLRAIAEELAGPAGEVWTVAPAFEQSGVGHCISYTKPMMITQLDERVFATEGSPADCVLAAIHDTMTAAPPDLVLSGVNRGNNAAENALYSGTLGGAIEAALQGLPAIALSQYYGPANRDLADPFEAAAQHGAETCRRILGRRPGTGFSTEAHLSPSGRRFLWIKGGDQRVQTAPGSDACVNLDGYVSVTPMRCDLTDHAALETLAGING